MWNILPDNTVLADNVEQFKSRLNKYWINHEFVFNFRADFTEIGSI